MRSGGQRGLRREEKIDCIPCSAGSIPEQTTRYLLLVEALISGSSTKERNFRLSLTLLARDRKLILEPILNRDREPTLEPILDRDREPILKLGEPGSNTQDINPR
jgi:hypothetical protein